MQDNKVEMCKLHTPYVCKHCGEELLFFVTNRNTLIDYKNLFVNGKTSPEIYAELQNKNIRSMKCIVCGKYYLIDWSEHFPQQLLDRNSLSKFGV
jgi:transcription elongation factor Elf1